MSKKLLAAALFCSTAISQVAGAEPAEFSLAEASTLREAFNLDNWDEGGPLMRYVFLNMSEFWNHSLIHPGRSPRELPVSLRQEVASFVTTTEQGEQTLENYLANSTVNGAIVLHRGAIVFERYPRMRPGDLHLHMSISKGFAATLVAIMEDRGQIDVSCAIETYLPALEGSGWEGVPVRDILDMASGIDCLEGEENAYSDPGRCYYQYEASLGWLRPTADTNEDPYAYVASLESHRPPGEAFEYTSVNTFVLSWLVERVSGRTYADLLSSEIWQHMGAGDIGLLAAPHRGIPIASGGISSTLRDLARFGLLFTPSGRKGEKPVISDRYLDTIQRRGRPAVFRAGRDKDDDDSLIDGEAPLHNSYQWDFVMSDGDFYKNGFGGQGLYISPSRDLVIGFFGTFDEDGEGHEMTRIARQLAKSGLFEAADQTDRVALQ